MVASAGRLQSKGRDGAWTIDDRRYSELWRVDVDSLTDTQVDALLATNIPSIGDTFSDDTGSYCVSLTPRSLDRYAWSIVAQYSSKQEFSTNPLNDPVVVTWDDDPYQKPAFEDSSGNAICNSAGDPFDPPPEVDDSRGTIIIQKNVGATPGYVRGYRNAVNSNAFRVGRSATDPFILTVAAESAKIRRFAMSAIKKRSGTEFAVLTIEMQVLDDADDWTLRNLDRGFNVKRSGDATKRDKVLLDDGSEPSEPVLLDGSGARLANPSASNAVFIEDDYYTLKAFENTIPGCLST